MKCLSVVDVEEALCNKIQCVSDIRVRLVYHFLVFCHGKSIKVSFYSAIACHKVVVGALFCCIDFSGCG